MVGRAKAKDEKSWWRGVRQILVRLSIGKEVNKHKHSAPKAITMLLLESDFFIAILLRTCN